MDYKTLHTDDLQGGSSPSIAVSEASEAPGRGGFLAALPEWTSDAIEELEGRLAAVAQSAPERLREPAMDALTSGGKRLRPMLLMLSAGMGAYRREEVMEAAVAIEVLHTATLIHDDIVDRAETRRGVPTAVARYGREVAVATGDYLFARTFGMLAGIGEPRLIRSFAEASEGLASGELTQYRANGVIVDVDAYLDHIKLKTAGLFKVACVAGGTLGRLSIRQIDALANYGQALGIAFQMSDDIMDLVGKPGLMGKGVGTDLVEGTVTLPIIFALQDGDARTIRRVLEDRNPPAGAIEAGIEAVLATDAVRKTEEWANGEIESAIRDLDLLPDSQEREFLEMVAAEIVGRDI